MTVATGTALRVVQTLVWDDGNVIQNVFNCELTGGAGPYDDQDVADDMADWMDVIYTYLDSDMVDQLTMGVTVTYKWDSGDQDWDEVGVSLPIVSIDGTGDALPHGVALMMQGNTINPDVKGRKYFGGLSEALQTDGSWVSGLITVMGNVGTAWLTDFVGAASGADFGPGVWSVKNLDFYAFATSFVVNSICNYQRRRRPGVGI